MTHTEYKLTFKNAAGKNSTQQFKRWGQTASMLSGLLAATGKVEVETVEVEDKK